MGGEIGEEIERKEMGGSSRVKKESDEMKKQTKKGNMPVQRR